MVAFGSGGHVEDAYAQEDGSSLLAGGLSGRHVRADVVMDAVGLPCPISFPLGATQHRPVEMMARIRRTTTGRI